MFGERREPLSPDERIAMEKARNNAQDLEYADMAAEYERLHAPPEIKKEAGPEIIIFNEMIAAFEQEHSLEALHLITDLTPSEAPLHPVREPARKALGPIVAKLEVLRNKVIISSEALEECEQEYKRITRAVGIINKFNNKVDHTR
ncbi:MAG: hypothetical protein ABH826_01215 [Patescibacteria group bacterium]